MKEEIPFIDFPETWLAGTDISRELLEMYAHYPVRLKCEMCVFCAGGVIEAMVNLKHISVHCGDVVMLPSGSIIQIDSVTGTPELYIQGFSERFIEGDNRPALRLEVLYQALERPVISLDEKSAEVMAHYFKLQVKLFALLSESVRDKVAPQVFQNFHTSLTLLYGDKHFDGGSLSQTEQLCRTFGQLVMRHYQHTRSVAWYAAQMEITQAYLSAVVRQVTGRTCMDIISSVVIMDAKAQLKQTRLSIQAISDSLGFPNASFFGKYFKRYVGISPFDYRGATD